MGRLLGGEFTRDRAGPCGGSRADPMRAERKANAETLAILEEIVDDRGGRDASRTPSSATTARRPGEGRTAWPRRTASRSAPASRRGNEPARGRDQPLPPPARRQPGRTGTRGATRRSSARARRASPSSSRSATRPATGATSWSTSPSRTRRPPRLMNERFVCVKVDREERPDVDGLYMEAVLDAGGHGGWPMTVFLDPDGRPFFGGTYYPPEPRYGLPSFRQVLGAVAEAYRDRRGDLDRQAGSWSTRSGRPRASRPRREPLTSGLLARAVSTLERVRPRARRLRRRAEVPARLRRSCSSAGATARRRSAGAADARRDGRRRHVRPRRRRLPPLLGGRRWLVPHFEKMLYDNALLARRTCTRWVVTGEERYRRVAEETLDYLVRELRLPEGGFASAQDADTDGVEGHDLHLDAGAEAVRRAASWLLPFEHGRSILRGAIPDDRRAQLLAERGSGPQPARDDKVARRLERPRARRVRGGGAPARPRGLPRCGAHARRVPARAALQDGRLLRSFRDGVAKIDGYLEDYADVANGLLELYTATGELRCLEEARRLALLAVERFEDPLHGGFFVARRQRLVARRKELDDHPTPSGNAMLATVLLRLARLYGDDELERKAVGVLRLAHSLLARAPRRSASCSARSTSTSRRPARSRWSERARSFARSGLARVRAEHRYAFADEPTDARPAAPGQGPRGRTGGRLRLRALRLPGAGHDSLDRLTLYRGLLYSAYEIQGPGRRIRAVPTSRGTRSSALRGSPRSSGCLQLPSGGDMLEVGCGRGRRARLRSPSCAAPRSLTGLDIDDGSLLAEARVAAPEADARSRATFAVFRFRERLVRPDCGFRHLLPRRRCGWALGEIERVLRPGGLFVHETPVAQLCAHPVRTSGRSLPWGCGALARLRPDERLSGRPMKGGATRV